jgi:hypothetical protein
MVEFHIYNFVLQIYNIMLEYAKNKINYRQLQLTAIDWLITAMTAKTILSGVLFLVSCNAPSLSFLFSRYG